jgi:hypothetical protein
MENWEFFAATACIVMLWVLLPLIPAILIYRLFPDTPIGISGILHGLKKMPAAHLLVI